MSVLSINTKENKEKANKALEKGKETQRINESKGGEWVKTFKGYKFVKNKKE